MMEDQTAVQRVSGATEEETRTNLLKASDRLCVSEGPGAGKSVFTRRVQAFLSSHAGREAFFGGKPALAVRWEEWDGSWPDDFHLSLARHLEPFCSGRDRQASARAVAEAALADNRVVLILDALDQVGTEERIRHLSDFLVESRRRGWSPRVTMTGRPLAVEQRKTTQRNVTCTGNRRARRPVVQVFYATMEASVIIKNMKAPDFTSGDHYRQPRQGHT